MLDNPETTALPLVRPAVVAAVASSSSAPDPNPGGDPVSVYKDLEDAEATAKAARSTADEAVTAIRAELTSAESTASTAAEAATRATVAFASAIKSAGFLIDSASTPPSVLTSADGQTYTRNTAASITDAVPAHPDDNQANNPPPDPMPVVEPPASS